MTATLSARQCDHAAGALCVVRSKERGDRDGLTTILGSIDPADLIQGFLILTSQLRAAYAAAAGTSVEQIDADTFTHLRSIA